jgi:hypothetical protein
MQKNDTNITAVEHKFNIGEIVRSVLDDEYTYVINAICISYIKNGNAEIITYDASSAEGLTHVFKEYEIELTENVNKSKD